VLGVCADVANTLLVACCITMQLQEEDVRVMSCVPVDAQSDSDSDAVGQTASDSKAAATAGAEPAASDSQQAAASNGGAAAGGLQKRKWKRPSGANRSPEYVEDAAEGDELLLLRPQNPDDINDDYDDGRWCVKSWAGCFVQLRACCCCVYVGLL
jgi:hypothetical protein